MKDRPNLSVIIPAYNEEAVIASTLDKLATYCNLHTELGKTEVIVVAAGNDKTAAIAASYTHAFHTLKVIAPPTRVGKGRDVRLGFQAAQGRYQLFTDADLSTPLHHIGDAVRLLESGSDIVIGMRDLTHIHAGKLRTLVSTTSNRFIRFLLLPGIHDSQCGFKAFRADTARKLFTDRLHINGWAFDVEILAAARQAHYHISELPIHDWQETRADDLRNESMVQALTRTFSDVVGLRISLWVTALACHIYILIALAGLISSGLALWIGMQQSIWFDEAYSAALVRHSFPQIVQLTAVDVHPPLYYFILKGWTILFGNSDLALRSLSVLSGGLAVVVGLLLVKRIWGARITVATLPFVVVAPFVIRYNFEVRMYALASLICMAATYVLVTAIDARSVKRRTWLWITYALLVAAGLYTLYYTAFVWIVHFLWWVYIARKHQKISWRRVLAQPWVGSYVLAATLFLPWVPVFHRQLTNIQGNFWVPPATYRRVVSVGSFFFNYKAEWQLDPWLSLIFMATAIACIYFIVAAFQSSSPARRRGLTLLTLYTVVPVIGLYVVSLPPLQPKFLERYDSQAILSAYLLVGVAIASTLRLRPTILRAAAALGVLAVLATGVVTLYHVGNFSFDQLDKPTARQIASYVQAQATPGEPIVADGPYSYIELVHYLPYSNLLFYSQGPTSTTGGYAMLHDSPLRVSSTNSFQGVPVWLIYVTDKPSYKPLHHTRTRGRQIGRYQAYLYIPT